ncbi:MAG TPA: FAD:protein FMN transferase [Verrucomicrobiae bacterium]|nr:FAD:protein FMN transferase [Verrucomicrobiae bacterium]
MKSRSKSEFHGLALWRPGGKFRPAETAAEHHRPAGISLRRCRPLLGTFVEITASGLPENALHAAINAAFVVMENIQNRMSAHDPASELSQLNFRAAARPVAVSRALFQILRRAERLASESRGAFDYTVAPTLARWRFLPAALQRKDAGHWRDVLLLPGRTVYFRRPLALDLGGIAKGFAVDAAVESLRRHGVPGGVVNAGGDLRAFGAAPVSVHLRHPARPQLPAVRMEIHNAALATSSPCFTEKNFQGRRVSHLVHPQKRAAVTGAVSVSVCAHECWLADALTKVVFNAPEPLARKILARHGAEALVLTA